jgi:hypothetical protein
MLLTVAVQVEFDVSCIGVFLFLPSLSVEVQCLLRPGVRSVHRAEGRPIRSDHVLSTCITSCIS